MSGQRMMAVGMALVGFGVLLLAGLPDRAEYAGGGENQAGTPIAPERNAQAPDIQGTLLSGDEYRLSAQTDAPTVVNFWATWCMPCQQEMPELERLHTELGVQILGVNVGEDAELVADWLSEREISYPILLDADGRVGEDYLLRGMPTTIIVAPDQTIQQIFYGAVTFETLQTALNP